MIADQSCPATSGGCMEVHGENTLQLSASIVTIGTFDGVHKGHQTLLREIERRARQSGVASVAYTFDPPPKTVFGNALQLTSEEEKIRRLSHFGIDHVVMARFCRSYANRSAESFVAELSRLNPLEVWVGSDFRFGRDRVGDVGFLARVFDVRILEEIGCATGERISSTRLRGLIRDGKLQEAQALHGWPGTEHPDPAQTAARSRPTPARG